MCHKAAVFSAQTGCMHFAPRENELIFAYLNKNELDAVSATNSDFNISKDDLAPLGYYGGRVPQCWQRMRKVAQITEYRPAVATLFLGRLRSPSGFSRLVVVNLVLGLTNDMRLGVITYVMMPEGVLSHLTVSKYLDGPGLSDDPSDSVSMIGWWHVESLRIYAGRVDAKDESLFEAKVTIGPIDHIDGIKFGLIKDQITGRLRDDGTVQIQIAGRSVVPLKKAFGISDDEKP